jgi:hypothetical protein
VIGRAVIDGLKGPPLALTNKCLAQMSKSPTGPKRLRSVDPREDPEAVVNAFLLHKRLEQMQDYLARGRRFNPAY